MFALLFWIELRSRGANLPRVDLRPWFELEALPWLYQYELIGIYFYHAVLLSFLIGVSLIRWDRQAVPTRLSIYGLLLGLLPPAVWPNLHPVPLTTMSMDIGPNMSGLLDGIAGALVGWCVARLLIFRQSQANLPRIVAVVGAFVGWQATVSIACIAAGVILMAALAGVVWGFLRDRPATVAVAVAAALLILFWRQLVQYVHLPSAAPSWVAVASGLFIMTTVSFLAFLVRSRSLPT